LSNVTAQRHPANAPFLQQIRSAMPFIKQAIGVSFDPYALYFSQIFIRQKRRSSLMQTFIGFVPEKTIYTGHKRVKIGEKEVDGFLNFQFFIPITTHKTTFYHQIYFGTHLMVAHQFGLVFYFIQLPQ
jgi:hypothetical protein